jgi:arylsulfatase A-like enzyme
MARFASSTASDECLPKALPVLGEVMHDRGYWTIGVLSNALLFAPAGFQRGFDEWLEVGQRLQDSRRFDLGNQLSVRPGDAEQVNAAAKQVLDRRPSDRFFLYLHYMDVHEYKRGSVGKPDWRRLYGEAVARVDAAIGEIIGALEEGGLLQGTVFVFTSDHGEQLKEPHFIEGLSAFEPEPGIGHEGNPSFDQLLKVPLIIAPAHLPR